MKTKFIFLFALLFTVIAGVQAQNTFSYAGRGGNPNQPTSSSIDGSLNASGNQKDHLKSTDNGNTVHINKGEWNEHGEHPDRRRRNDKIYHPYNITSNTVHGNSHPQDGVINTGNGYNGNPTQDGVKK